MNTQLIPIGNHTQGEWAIDNLDTATTFLYIKGKTGSIASVPNRAGGEGEANARLICAAPAMLEALQYTLGILTHMTTDQFTKGADKQARQLIEKAINQATT